MTATTCPQCGAAFQCSPQPDQRCWCLDLPPLPVDQLGREAAGCYCPACLRNKLDQVGLMPTPPEARP